MSQPDDPPADEMAPPHPAERLEAALERIARVATAEIIRAGRTHAAEGAGEAEDGGASPAVAEIAARLDELILRLRAVLAETV